MMKKASTIFSFLLTLALSVALIQPIPAKAAPKIRLSATTLQVDQGKTAVLKLYNTKEKPVFKSSNTNVVTINKNGRIAGRNKGTATVTATLKNKKKYTCKVTVNFPKKNVNTDVEDPVFTQILQITDGVSLQIPENLGYELYEHNDKKIQYVCFQLPDDEQNGCIYITAKPCEEKGKSMADYATLTLKQLVKKQQDMGYLVQNASLNTIRTKNGVELGVISFKNTKESLTCHEIIFIQKVGENVFFYECISRQPKVLNSYEPISLHMADTLTLDSTIPIQIP